MLLENQKSSASSRSDSAQPTAQNSLNARHYQECIEKRGLNPQWSIANCYSVTANVATQYLGYIAQSDGIWLEGCNHQSQFKPDKPWKKEGDKKAPKYRSPLGEYDAMLPTHPTDPHYWDDIEKLKHKAFNIDGHPCLVITEGFFKAIAACNICIPTIALLGVEMGLTSKDADPQGKRYLVPTLERFAKARFGFIIGFDADCAENESVVRAQRTLAHQIKLFKVPVYSITGLWTVAEGKGMDDYIQNHGDKRFIREVMRKTVNIEAWEKQFQVASKPKPLSDPDYVGNGTVDGLILDTLFERGAGQWATIEDTYYRETGRGYWERVPDKSVLKAIALKCKSAYDRVERKDGVVKVFRYAKDSHKQSAFRYCRDALYVDNLPSNQHLRCFSNCTVDVRTGEAIPHDKAHFLTTSVAADYKPNQPCPQVFLDFIKSAYGEDLINPIRAYTSMLLDPTAPYGKFIHLMGPSGSGKGTLLRFWGEMFALDNFRSGDFKNLATAEGRHQYLTGAALYAVPDVGGFVQGLKAFYELVDNGPMSGRALFCSQGYQKIWNTRFVIASVDHLQIENSGDGWERRCLPLPTKARSGIEDPNLGTKLASVKGQIISWALAMPREERDRLILHPSSNERVQLLKQDAAIHGDPVRAFVDLCLRPGDALGETHSHSLHSWFAAFAQTHGYQSWGMTKFVNHLKTILPNHYVSRRRAPSSKNREMIPAHWVNIQPIPEAFVDISERGAGQGDYPRDGYQDMDTVIEPTWKCIKSECREGGLVAFLEFKSGSATRVGSAGKAIPPKVADPKNSTHYQAFQDFGSLGSAGSDRGGVCFNSQIKLSPTATVVNSGVAPEPVADPSDPSDPKPETLDFAYQDLDQSIVSTKKLVADPPLVPDPNSSAVKPNPNSVATDRWENFRWESGKRVWFEGQQWRIVIVNHYGNKEVSLKPVDADINYPPRYVPMGDLIANGEPAT